MTAWTKMAFLLLIALPGCAAPAHRGVRATPEPPGIDEHNSVYEAGPVAAIGQAIYSNLSFQVARAAVDTLTTVLLMEFPDAESPTAWQMLRVHLMRSLRGRTQIPDDTLRTEIIVKNVAISDDTLRFRLEIGSQHRCGRTWWDNSTYWTGVSQRVYDTWTSPRLTWMGESLSMGC